MPNTAGTVTGSNDYPPQEAYFDSSPTIDISSGVDDNRGLNELRRRLRENLRWTEGRLLKVKAALELLENDEAYNTYTVINAAR